MMICPRCESIIRDGAHVRLSVLAQMFREGVEGHTVHIYEEEWMEHQACEPEPWEARLVKAIKRKLRWLRSR